MSIEGKPPLVLGDAERIVIGKSDVAFMGGKEALLGDALAACVRAISIAHKHLPCECGADWEQSSYWDAISRARESLSRSVSM